MVGTSNDAMQALFWERSGLRSKAWSRDGTTRNVYLINGVVYKIEHFGMEGINAVEHDTMLNMRNSLPDNVSYPLTTLYSFNGIEVLAMEYIKGQAIYQCVDDFTGEPCDDCCMTADEINLLIDILDDPSGFNTIRTNNGYYIIDAV